MNPEGVDQQPGHQAYVDTSAVRGTFTVKAVPPDAVDVTATDPPCPSTMFFTMKRPSPTLRAAEAPATPRWNQPRNTSDRPFR